MKAFPTVHTVPSQVPVCDHVHSMRICRISIIMPPYYCDTYRMLLTAAFFLHSHCDVRQESPTWLHKSSCLVQHHCTMC